MNIKVSLMAFFAIVFVACSSNKTGDEAQDINTALNVEFVNVNGLFFRNDQPCPSDVLLINSKEELEQYFGYATTMDTKPIDFDFDNKAVLAVVLPVTDIATEVYVTSVTAAKTGDIEVKYLVKTGDKQSYTMQPISLVEVSKQDITGKVISVKEQHSEL